MRSWLTFTILCFAILCFAASTSATDFNNGCGSGWYEPLIPDRIGPLCVNFQAACAAHDNCYSKCLENGENFGQPICEQPSIEQREGRRASCDANFKAKMKNSCNTCDPVQRFVCKGIATIYAIAVSVGGGGLFEGDKIPESYYDFLTSEQAQSFDFDAFVRDIEALQRMSAVRGNNRLRLSIQGGKPIANFQSIPTVQTSGVYLSNDILRIDAIRYGDVDLSKAGNGNRALRIQDLDLTDLDIEKLQNLQRFVPAKP